MSFSLGNQPNVVGLTNRQINTMANEDSRYGLNTLPGRLLARPVGTALRAATLGNSIIAGVNGISFTDQALYAGGGNLQWLANGGVAGNTTAMMLARIDQSVPWNTEVCLVMEGSNDAINGVSVDDHRANMEAIIQRLLFRGIVPVILASAPVNAQPAAVTTMVAAETLLALKYGVSIYDPWRNVLDIANGQWIGANTTDGVHPTFAAAVTAKGDLNGFINGTNKAAPFGPRANAVGVGGYTLSGGNNLMGTNVANVPTGWSQAGTATPSIAAAPAGFIGNFARLTGATATGNPYLTKTISSGWAIGDELALSFAIEANAGNTPQQVFVTLRVDGVEQQIMQTVVANIPAQRVFYRFKPQTLAALAFFAKINGAGTGNYVGIGEFEVYNLTRLGGL